MLRASVEIRRATIDDAKALAQVHVQAWRDAYAGLMPDEFLAELEVAPRTAGWRERMDACGSTLWLACIAAEVAGWAYADASRDDDALAGTAELWGLNVAPAFWRRGVGRALMHATERTLLEQGFAECTLWVLQGNARALSFYSSFDFEVEQGVSKSRDFGGRQLNELRMRKRLTRAAHEALA